MVKIGTKVLLEISEPWDAYRVLSGRIIRVIGSEDYFAILDNEQNELLIVTNRYEGEPLCNIVKGKEVTVGIAVPKPGLNVLNLAEINHDTFQQLDYKYIGGMKLDISA